MPKTNDLWIPLLLRRLAIVQRTWGSEAEPANDADVRFADVLDSMALVEFLAGVADECGVTVAAIEECVGRRFGTVSELAAALTAAGFKPVAQPLPADLGATQARRRSATPWFGPFTVKLPQAVQSAAAINAAVGRPAGWLEKHAGIQARRVWADEDPLEGAATAGLDCLHQARLRPEDVGVLLVTSEAPPLLVGLAGNLHHRLRLPVHVPALEVGGACTGFLAALLVGRGLLPQAGVVLIIAVEAPTAMLRLTPGPAGEAAALFGDAAAAALLCAKPKYEKALGLIDVFLRTDGNANGLLQAHYEPGREVTVHFRGVPLAERAIRAMAGAVSELATTWGLAPADLAAVVAHGGNGRMPQLLARQLGLPAQRVWSETPTVGNLGSASLPVAWAAQPTVCGPVIWTAAGAGLSWGAALTEGPSA